jgi:hypothetical protein
LHNRYANSAQKPYDWITLIALAAFTYAAGTFLHEVAGHGLSCVLLGGRLREIDAFYIDCDYAAMGDLSIRLVALAGPLASFVTGMIAFSVLSRLSAPSSHWKVFLWLFGTLGFLTSTGYLMFSGIGGLGDFGTSRDGALYQLSPEWVWRTGITLLGLVGYLGSVFLSLRRMDALIGGSGRGRVARAQTLSLVAYLSGCTMSVLVGFLNPQGLIIVLISAAAASIGGTSALAWMMQWLNRKKETAQPMLTLPRSWVWIGVCAAGVLLYALILGPSLRP